MQQNGETGARWVTIPKPICESKGWNKGTVFKVIDESDGIKLKPLRE